jgi:carboxypeptidase Q
MRATRIACAVFLLVTPALVLAQSLPGTSFTVSQETRNAVQQLIGDSTLNGKAYAYERELADGIGPRLTGSSNYMRAAEWAAQHFKEMGLANVHTEDWTIPATWEPNAPAAGRIEKPIQHELHVYSIGWSPSTPPSGVEADVVYVKSMVPEELDKQKAELAGKIAFADGATFGEKATVGPVLSALAKLHSFSPAAIVISGGANGTLAESAFSFDGVISSVPEAQIGREDASLVKRLLERGPVIMQFSFSNTIRSMVPIPTVVAEIPGRDLPGEMVIVGAHLDSWQPGTGAQDNGTGVATVLEVARAIKALNRPPRRTIRFLLFGGEEEGLLGSGAYARQHVAEMPKIDAVLVSDTGSAPAKGWYVMGREDEKGALTALKPLLGGLGADGISTDVKFIFATDDAAFDVLGVPSLVLWNDMEKYDQIKHRAADTFDSVVERDLVQDAVVTAVTAYAIADSKEPFAPHVSAADVQSMLRKADSLDDYSYLKSTGALP